MQTTRRANPVANGLTTLFVCFALAVSEAKAAIADSSAEIRLGMSTVLTGYNASLGKDMQLGILAALERTNRNGGSNGHKLRLITLDDGYQAKRTAPNMRQLIEKENVLAVIGNVGTPTAIAAVPLANELRTLLFAPFSGGGILRQNPPDRYVINYRASYVEELQAMIDALIDIGGLKPEEIAFFTPSIGPEFFAAGLDVLKRHGLRDPEAIVHVSYEGGTIAVERAVANLLMAKNPPRALVLVGTYAPCARFIKLCQNAGLRPLFLSVSFVGSNSFVEMLGQAAAPVIVTQVVPYPSDDSVPIVREYKADLGAIDPTASAGFVDLEGYIDARILTFALQKIQGAPTREAIVDALQSLGQFEIGLGEPLQLSQTEHQACHQVWPSILRDGRFVPFRWSEITTLIKGKAPL
jgi:branched-chain amino acid transport system substrate-binding protein